MEFTFKELKKKRETKQKEIASGLDSEEVKGYTQLTKDLLLKAICKALKLEMHEHHEVVGVDKSAIKQQIRSLKKKRDKAIKDRNKIELKTIRIKIKNFRKQLRRATV